MRIRKQAKLAGVSISNGISSGDLSLSSIGLFCHLSQSPWDVISDSPPSLIDGFAINGSSADSVGPVESVASMRVCEANGETNNLSVSYGKNLRQADAPDAKEPVATTAGAAVVATDGRKKRWAPVSDPGYYYYSGFGPCWGKQRGGTEPPEDRKYDYIDEYDTDEYDDDDVDVSGEIGRKRGRKPVKARSLKSLM